MSKEQHIYLKKIKQKQIYIKINQLLILLIFIITWQLLSHYEIINSFIFSSPIKVFNTFITLLKDGSLITHTTTTLKEIIIALTIGSTLGFIIAIIFYLSPTTHKILEPFLASINSLPKVALGPMLIIWFGANSTTIIVMALLINLIITTITILNGFLNTDSTRLLLLKSFKASKYQLLKYLIIPSSKYAIISAIKLNISMTLIGVIMGEFLVSRQGIGYLIIYGTQIFNLDLVITGIIILLIISMILFKIISTIESNIVRQ